MERKLKKEVKYGLYAVCFIAIVGLIYSIEKTLFPVSFKEKENYDYVSKTIFDGVVPVIGENNIIKRPYNDTLVKIIKKYYDYNGSEDEQEHSLIYNDSTYMQSSGVSYGKNEIFEVVSILDGMVIDVKEDKLLGKIIEIRHTNDVISIYQSLSEANCKINDTVKQGDIIGKSGNSNISTTLGNHLYFELIIKGENVNPELYYDKKLSDF
ncbi:MAG: M23 family metallopeptidase [Bacilli bacterium]